MSPSTTSPPAVGHAHISTTLRYDRRRKQRKTGAFRAVSGLVAEDHSNNEDERDSGDTLAAYDAEQLPGQTTVPLPGYDH